jgi:hypothetical protein
MALASEMPGDGSYLFENTRFLDLKSLVDEEDSKELNEVNLEHGHSKTNQYQVITDKGFIYTDNVVVASHFPVYDPDGLIII